MQDLNDLYYFVQVVEHQGFAPAGRALGIPKSKLSRRISLLEERLGVRLLQRSTRHFSVTEIGQQYYRHCVAMLVEAEAANELIERQRAEPQGIVRLSCPTTLLHYRIAPLINAFMARYPKVIVQIEATNRRVDVLAEGLDLALRVRFPPLEDSDLVMRILGESEQRLVASPSLLKGLTLPLSPTDLCTLPSLSGTRDQPHRWLLQGPNEATAEINHTPRLITDDMNALHAAVLAGIGVVQLPLMVVDKDLAQGTLMDLLPEWAPRRGIVHAVFASRRGQLPAVRTLIDFLVENFEV